MADNARDNAPKPDLHDLPLFADPANPHPPRPQHPVPARALAGPPPPPPTRPVADPARPAWTIPPVYPDQPPQGYGQGYGQTYGQGYAAAPTGPADLPGYPQQGTHRTPEQTHAASRHDWRPNWSAVRQFRSQAADLLSAQLRDRDDVLDDAGRRELGRSIITDLLNQNVEAAMATGGEIWPPERTSDMVKAVMDALFGLGRLQPLVDDDRVENIEIFGHDRVYLELSDGQVIPADPVADSDEELVDAVAFLASRSEGNERPFSPATPMLNMRLDSGERLAATAWITPRPAVVIRRHRLQHPTLDDLIATGVMTRSQATFLAAAVRARKSIVLCGPQGVGKTTALRALISCFDRLERFGIVETEDELHLHELAERHPRMIAWEARPGSGERTADGSLAGEITLDEIIFNMFRYNLKRLIVGEVRGKEILAMFKAMQATGGSLSTTHAHSARAAIERLATAAMEAGAHVTEAFAYRQIAEHIDLIVQLDLEDTPAENGTMQRRRYITEIIALESSVEGTTGRPTITEIYRPGHDGRAIPHTLNEEMRGLTHYGFDGAGFSGMDGGAAA